MESLMSRLIKLSLFGLLVGCVAATSAEAGHGYGYSNGGCQPSYNNYGNGYGTTYGNTFGSTYNNGYNGYGSTFGQSNYGYPTQGFSNYSRQPTYHNTTHLDYHPPTAVRHNGHIDVQPGHYDVHQTGHLHR